MDGECSWLLMNTCHGLQGSWAQMSISDTEQRMLTIDVGDYILIGDGDGHVFFTCSRSDR